jgi:hypothetical protein
VAFPLTEYGGFGAEFGIKLGMILIKSRTTVDEAVVVYGAFLHYNSAYTVELIIMTYHD